MAYRKRVSKNVSRKLFRRTSGTHFKNLKLPIQRGGIRL